MLVCGSPTIHTTAMSTLRERFPCQRSTWQGLQLAPSRRGIAAGRPPACISRGTIVSLRPMTVQPTPTTAVQVLPQFNNDGNLPAGDYFPTTSDFEARFVRVPGSTTREEIYKGFQRHRQELLACMVPPSANCLLDGSFTTSKVDPHDIDLVVVLDPATIPASHAKRVGELLSGPGAKQDYHCDAYALLEYPTNHPYYNSVTVQGRAYWLKWFGRDRRGNDKGRVWSEVGGFK
jgi:hypothetical protein